MSSKSSDRPRRVVSRISLPSRGPSKQLDPPADLHPPTGRPSNKGKGRRSVSEVSSSNKSSSTTSRPPTTVYAKRFLPRTVSSGTAVTETSSSTGSTLNNPDCPVNGVNSDLFAHYRVMNGTLGTGKYGSVRECFSRSSGRSFAVKSINKAKVTQMDPLREEIINLANVDHENIIKMVDCYEDAGFVHIVTEKYTGGELFDKIMANRSNAGCLSEVKAARIIKSLLKAVAYLHSRDIVHRDIKPENILFAHSGDDSDIKLVDFGLSRIHKKDDEPMSNPVGTSYYMSPEVLKGKYDKSCDVWSIGIVAYILLCGYPPFNGASDEKIHDAILGGRLRFTGRGWNDKSRRAQDFISCLLRRDRDRLSIKEALKHPWIVKS